jgi:hypothetical protein
VVADGNDCSAADRVLKPGSPRRAPSGDERAISELADADGCEEDLVAGHAARLMFEREPPARG